MDAAVTPAASSITTDATNGGTLPPLPAADTTGENGTCALPALPLSSMPTSLCDTDDDDDGARMCQAEYPRDVAATVGVSSTCTLATAGDRTSMQSSLTHSLELYDIGDVVVDVATLRGDGCVVARSGPAGLANGSAVAALVVALPPNGDRSMMGARRTR